MYGVLNFRRQVSTARGYENLVMSGLLSFIFWRAAVSFHVFFASMLRQITNPEMYLMKQALTCENLWLEEKSTGPQVK
jgi:hypothetical protein